MILRANLPVQLPKVFLKIPFKHFKVDVKGNKTSFHHIHESHRSLHPLDQYT